MPRIIVENLVKTFRVGKRQAGLWNAMKAVFSREYSVVKAVDGISFSIEEGELVGYIGPNGAGKSTTVKILSGILLPDSGRCEVMGRVPWRERIQHVRNIGVVFGQRCQLWWDLPVVDSFDLLRDIYRIPSVDYVNARNELCERLSIGDLLDTPVRLLSLGQRMRCELAASLLHRPSLLFLDEPTIGLDAVSKLAVREFIQQVNRERGVTIILTTHDMDDIEALCHRVMVIGKGRILTDGTVNDLRHQVSREKRLVFDLSPNAPPLLSGACPPGSRLQKVEGSRVWLYFDPQRVAASELVEMLTRRHGMRDFLVENPPIDEVVAALYGEWSI